MSCRPIGPISLYVARVLCCVGLYRTAGFVRPDSLHSNLIGGRSTSVSRMMSH